MGAQFEMRNSHGTIGRMWGLRWWCLKWHTEHHYLTGRRTPLLCILVQTTERINRAFNFSTRSKMMIKRTTISQRVTLHRWWYLCIIEDLMLYLYLSGLDSAT
jgi:hypothetical protein